MGVGAGDVGTTRVGSRTSNLGNWPYEGGGIKGKLRRSNSKRGVRGRARHLLSLARYLSRVALLQGSIYGRGACVVKRCTRDRLRVEGRFLGGNAAGKSWLTHY